MTQLTDNIWAVGVPDWANGYRIESLPQVDLYELTCYEIGEYNEPKREHGIDLPPGSWQFLFTTNEATEEHARKVVGNGDYADRVGGRYYKISESRMAIFKTDDPKIALTALLKAKGCDVNKNYAIIQKL